MAASPDVPLAARVPLRAGSKFFFRAVPPVMVLVFAGTLLPAPRAIALTDAPLAYLGSRGQIRLTLPRVETGPRVDGVLDDSVWARAAVLDSFVHQQPIDGVRDTLGTRCLALYDGHALYLGFHCADRPGAVRAPLVPRDRLLDGDYVAVAIDAYHDFQRALVFGANPRGQQIDGIDTDADGFDDAPDFQFRSEARLVPDGWEVEIEVPFRSLRFPERDTVSFGFNAARFVSRDNVTMFWAPISLDQVSSHAQQGTFEGLHGIRPGRNIQVIPGMTVLGRSTLLGGHLWSEGRVSNLNFDMKSAIGTSFTFDGTANPDFSQIEADAAVVDVNQRFAIFYPEKRPFFLEGSDLFTTPITAVYTRRITDPWYGLKLTGRTRHLAVGALQALDRGDALFNVARLRRDLWQGSTAGVIATDREDGPRLNRVAGIDTRMVWLEHWRFTGQALASRSFGSNPSTPAAPPDSTSSSTWRSGHAFHLEAARETRGLEVGASLDDLSPQFEADAGFVPRVNMVAGRGWVEPHFYAQQATWYTGIHPELSFERIWDHGSERWTGRLADELAQAGVSFELPRSTQVEAVFSRRYTYFGGSEFPNQYRYELSTQSDRWNAVRFGGTLSGGDAVIFEEVKAGRSIDYDLWAHLRPNPSIEIRPEVRGSVVTRVEAGTRYADAVIPRLSAQYQFTRELWTRAIGEVQAERTFDDSGARATSLRHVTLDLLLGYLLHPGSVVYLGYGSGLDGENLAGARPTSSGFFFKVSWLFQD